MRLNNVRHRRRPLNLTPLIDVVFLLLVFFMLASTFLKFGTVALETGQKSGATVTDPATIVLVHVGTRGTYRVNGRDVSPSALGATLTAAIATGRKDAIVALSSGATVNDLVAGLAVVRRANFTSVRVVE